MDELKLSAVTYNRFETENLLLEYSPDFSNVRIVPKDLTTTPPIMDYQRCISAGGKELVEFVVHCYIVPKQVSVLEKELLQLKVSSVENILSCFISKWVSQGIGSSRIV